MRNKIVFLIFTFLILSFKLCFALPLRSELNKANDLYNQKLFYKAGQEYGKILKGQPKDNKTKFNLGNSFYKLGEFEESQRVFATLTQEAKSAGLKEKAFYNLGNNYFQQQAYQGAIDAYEEALKIEPDDKDAKYNLALAKKLLKEPPPKKDDKKDKDKNKDKDKDQQDQKQNKPGQMNEQDAERILKALENKEKHKDKKEGQGLGAGKGKDW